MSTNFENEMIEDSARLQRIKLQSKLNAMNIEEIPLPPLPLERSEIFRGNKQKKGFGDEEQLIEKRVLCSWGPAEWQEEGIVNLQSGILKKIGFVNGKKYYYVDIDRKDYAGKVVQGEFIMDFPAEHVRIEATENIVYPSTKDSSGNIKENESGIESEKRQLAEEKEKDRKEKLGGKKRKTYKKHKKVLYKKYKKTKKHRKRRR